MIYIDSLIPALNSRRWRYGESCHMVADTLEELHEFARKLGLKRQWFQNAAIPHYDLTAQKRREAIAMGAKIISRRELIQHFRRPSVSICAPSVANSPVSLP